MTRRNDDSLVTLDELASVLRAHEGPPQPVTNGTPKRTPRGGRYRRAALLASTVTLALLLGSGLGFGISSSLTASVSAGRNVVGFGFLPDRGWNVTQTGGANPGTTTAFASKDGISISVRSTPRGDPSKDAAYVVRELPLRIADALPVGAGPTHLELRAAVGGYNVDATISFAVAKPTQTMIAAAQRQLGRLVVAADRVTIAARPAIAPPDKSVTLFGSVENGRAGETVEIQAKDCGQSFFRAVAGTSSVEGGGWSLEFYPVLATTVRAVWNGSASPQITVRKRAMIHLTPKPGGRGRFTVWIVARSSFWRKRVVIQRRDQRLGVWKALRSVVLTEQASGGGTVASFSADVKLTVPAGTQLRAMVPPSQARPCYLSGTSLPVRT